MTIKTTRFAIFLIIIGAGLINTMPLKGVKTLVAKWPPAIINL